MPFLQSRNDLVALLACWLDVTAMANRSAEFKHIGPHLWCHALLVRGFATFSEVASGLWCLRESQTPRVSQT